MLSVGDPWVPLRPRLAGSGISVSGTRERAWGWRHRLEGQEDTDNAGHLKGALLPRAGVWCTEGEKSRSHCNKSQRCPDVFFDARVPLGKSQAISQGRGIIVARRVDCDGQWGL